MKTRTLAISILLLTIVLAPMALAADEPAPRGPRGPRGGQGEPGGYGGPRMGGGEMTGRLVQMLDLTEEQKEKIDAIQEECRPKVEKAREAIREAQQALEKAIEEGSDEDIMSAAKKVGEALGKQGIVRAQTQRKIKEVLTPEQLKKWEELKTQMRERMQQRGPRGEGGRGRGGNGEGDQNRRGRGREPREE